VSVSPLIPFAACNAKSILHNSLLSEFQRRERKRRATATGLCHFILTANGSFNYNITMSLAN
jgi:hypothetical protein